ncbi:flagella synthesis protein FlgN [Azospira restricta]|uniref:Flagellar protein FlgN n=1 Tax=Azospira restricta TaxID=404405 RepID=A0A974Y5J8_9RHOO|nr:flagellar protein FlgN [Azospira restricta]QRJ65448.1 flagellar protein FlgN [Azospira restricta]
MPALADVIAAEADVVSAFVALLKEEQEVLKTGSADALPALVDRKTATVQQLAPLTAARNGELARAGFAADRPGIDAWLAKNPGDRNVRQQWQKLQALAAEARELNRVNGELIRLRMHNNAQALETLLAASQRQDLYGADGQATQAAPRRIIDSA